jgi:hypothetical protein
MLSKAQQEGFCETMEQKNEMQTVADLYRSYLGRTAHGM